MSKGADKVKTYDVHLTFDDEDIICTGESREAPGETRKSKQNKEAPANPTGETSADEPPQDSSDPIPANTDPLDTATAEPVTKDVESQKPEDTGADKPAEETHDSSDEMDDIQIIHVTKTNKNEIHKWLQEGVGGKDKPAHEPPATKGKKRKASNKHANEKAKVARNGNDSGTLMDLAQAAVAVEAAKKAEEAQAAEEAKKAEEAQAAKEAEAARKAQEAQAAKEAKAAKKAEAAQAAKRAKEAETARIAQEAQEAQAAKEAEAARKTQEALEKARKTLENVKAKKAKEAEAAQAALEAEAAQAALEAEAAKEAETAQAALEAEAAQKAKEARTARAASKKRDLQMAAEEDESSDESHSHMLQSPESSGREPDASQDDLEGIRTPLEIWEHVEPNKGRERSLSVVPETLDPSQGASGASGASRVAARGCMDGPATKKTMLELMRQYLDPGNYMKEAQMQSYKWPVAQCSQYIGKTWQEEAKTNSWSGPFASTGNIMIATFWDFLEPFEFTAEGIPDWNGFQFPPVEVMEMAIKHLRSVIRTEPLTQDLRTRYDHLTTLNEIIESVNNISSVHPAFLIGFTAVTKLRLKPEDKARDWGVRIWKQNESGELCCPKSLVTRIQSLPEKKITNRDLIFDILALYDQEKKYWLYTPLKFHKD